MYVHCTLEPCSQDNIEEEYQYCHHSKPGGGDVCTLEPCSQDNIEERNISIVTTANQVGVMYVP